RDWSSDVCSSDLGAHPGGGDGLPRVGAQVLQVGGERPVGAQEGFHAHGGGEVGDVDQGGQVVQGEDEHAEHAFGAVGEGEAFFFAQGDGFEAGFGECFGGGAALPAGGEDFAFSGEGEGDGGERGEVSGAAQ